ncbi:hypothetical protein BU17DRAFT_95464 [Hysterangium stoloniferum]|nr:hypothetical protein BU17DRAFT_95464 [Hysterangium stoloniferum]
MNNDLLPALDYAFAILDAEKGSLSLILSDGSYSVSSDQTSNSSTSMPHIPSSPTGSSVTDPSHLPSPVHFTQEHVKTLDSCRQVTLDPNEFSCTLTHAKFNGHRCDYFVSHVCPSTTSVNALDSGLVALLACHPSPIRTLSIETIPPNAGPQGIETTFSDAFTLRYFIRSTSSASVTGCIPLSFGSQEGLY